MKKGLAKRWSVVMAAILLWSILPMDTFAQVTTPTDLESPARTEAPADAGENDSAATEGTPAPAVEETEKPEPTAEATAEPTTESTAEPTTEPTAEPTAEPTPAPAIVAFDVSALSESMTVPYGTAEIDLGLPGTLTALFADGTSAEVAVTWACVSNGLGGTAYNPTPEDLNGVLFTFRAALAQEIPCEAEMPEAQVALVVMPMLMALPTQESTDVYVSYDVTGLQKNMTIEWSPTLEQQMRNSIHFLSFLSDQYTTMDDEIGKNYTLAWLDADGNVLAGAPATSGSYQLKIALTEDLELSYQMKEDTLALTLEQPAYTVTLTAQTIDYSSLYFHPTVTVTRANGMKVYGAKVQIYVNGEAKTWYNTSGSNTGISINQFNLGEDQVYGIYTANDGKTYQSETVIVTKNPPAVYLDSSSSTGISSWRVPVKEIPLDAESKEFTCSVAVESGYEFIGVYAHRGATSGAAATSFPLEFVS